MEKLGVVTTVNKNSPADEKTAEEKIVCPVCQEEILTDNNVPCCPEHGTEPFEK